MVIKKLEKGQTLILIVVSAVVLIGMAALIVDGGYAYLNRRIAQTAADAAALAGARTKCISHGTTTEINDIITDYAINENGATAVSWQEIAYQQIEVTATVEKPTFFAKIFNKPTVAVQAKAAAGCFNPGTGTGMLPVAWACKPPVSEWTESPDCEYYAMDWITEFEPLITGVPSSVVIDGVTYTTPFDFETDMLPDLYIIMESLPASADCETSIVFDCDLNDDGKIDLLGNGSRNWLDLNGGGGGASELVDWLDNGFSGALTIHTWVGSEPGDDVSIYHAAADHVGEVVLLPVFNQFCNDPDPLTRQDCLDAAHAEFPGGPDIVIYSTSSTYYHIVGFANFFISCVDAPAEQNCPGHNLAVSQSLGLIPANTKSIEGYFITGYPTQLTTPGTGGVDLGVYVLSLTE